jgi:hypothetical protein
MSDLDAYEFTIGDLVVWKDQHGLRTPSRNERDTFTVLDSNFQNYVDVLNNRTGARSFMHVSVIKRVPL